MNKEILCCFMNEVINRGLLIHFIKTIFGIDRIDEFNSVFNYLDVGNNIIMDIYDCIDGNHFNRYIFSFSDTKDTDSINGDINVYVYEINKIGNSSNKIEKFAKLFGYPKDRIYLESKNIFDDKISMIFKDILKKD